jgi:protein required for attachment to host cells
MVRSLPAKLIVVLSSFKAKFLEANGLKVTKTIKEFDYKEDLKHHTDTQDFEHVNNPRHQGYTHRSSTQSHFFDPKHTAQEIERIEFTRLISKQLHSLFTSNPKLYNEVIIVAEPKAMGELNHALDNHLKSLVTKQVSKDLVHHQISDIERVVFS